MRPTTAEGVPQHCPLPVRILAITLLLAGGCGPADPATEDAPRPTAAAASIHPVARGGQRPVSTDPAGDVANPADAPHAGIAVDPRRTAGTVIGGTDAASAPSPARALMERVIARYRSATAYRDDGVVRLEYLQSGVPQLDQAPLRVRYEAQGRLRLTAYSLDLACDAGQLYAQIDGPAAGDLQRQRLRRTIPDGPLQLAQLYSDPAVLHFASAGLGGPSPQVELLLAPEPLAGLFSGQARLEWGAVATIDGSACRAVIVDAAPLRYVFWVDPQELLVRRIELPLQGLPEALKDVAIESPRLTIELVGAAFAREPNEPYKLAAAPNAVAVRRFVPRPPPLASDAIGRSPAAFQLRSDDGTITVSQHGAGGKAAVLLWIADHDGSQLAANQLQAVAADLPESVRSATEFLLVMAEPEAHPQRSTGGATAAMLQRWQVDLPWADDRGAVGRDVFQIQTTPAACLLSPDGRLQWFAHPADPAWFAMLPSLLTDVAAGVDVGARVRAQYDAALRTYEQQLQAARWDHGQQPATEP